MNQDVAYPGRRARPAPTAGAVRSRRADPRLAFGLAASVLLVAAACRELLRFAPRTSMVVSLRGDVEEWFFEPSDSSPGVVVLLCGWLLWRRRRRLAALWGRTGPLAATAGLWIAALGAFWWAVWTGAPDLQAVALVPALLGSAHLLGGPAALRVVALPSAVLLFALPLPAPLLNQVVWHLQLWTAQFTGQALGLLGYPALVSGDRIIQSDAVFAIIETCSGLRAIETLALLSVLMIDLFERRGLHAALVFAASPLVAFLINGLRCVGLIFNPHADVASIHSLQGIVMLLGGVLLLYFFDGLLERVLPARAARPGARPAGARTSLGPRVAAMVGFGGLLLALSWAPGFATPPVAAHKPGPVLDATLDGWQARFVKSLDFLFLGRAAFQEVFVRHYERGRDRVDLFLGPADPSRRLRSYLSPKIAYPGSGWLVESEERTRLAGRPVTLRVLRNGSRRELVAHWFEASPGLAAETFRTLLALDASPLQRERVPVAVRLSTPLPSAVPRARVQGRARLERFAERLAPALETISTPREAWIDPGKGFSQNYGNPEYDFRTPSGATRCFV